MKKNILILSFLFFSVQIYAQGEKPAHYFGNLQTDLTFGIGSSQYLATLSAAKLYAIGKKKKFQIGYGLRYNAHFGNNQNFVTAPAELTTGAKNPTVLFQPNIPENFDTLNFASSQVNSINLNIHLLYAMSKKLDISFNIDFIGFSFGAARNGLFTSKGNSSFEFAKPTSFNLLLISDNDLGNLNSELFLRYWLKEKFGIKFGLSFLFTEYTTDRELPQNFNNDRFRNKALLGMLGITWKPFKN